MLRRLKFASFLVLAVCLGPRAEAGALSDQQASPVSQKERREKIEMVSEWYANMAQDPGARLMEASNGMALQATLQLGNGAESWNSSNPNWKRVYDKVSADVRADMEHFTIGRGHEINSVAEASFVDALSLEEVHALTEFAKSKEGRRYWQLSLEVNRLFGDTVASARTGDFKQSTTNPTPNEVASWERILKASNAVRILLVMTETGQGAGGDRTGWAGMGVLIGIVISSHRDDFVRMATTYRDDLRSFDAFNESPLGKRQIQALVVAINELELKMAEISLEFENKISSHQASWKQLYLSAVLVVVPADEKPTRRDRVGTR